MDSSDNGGMTGTGRGVGMMIVRRSKQRPPVDEHFQSTRKMWPKAIYVLIGKLINRNYKHKLC
jgi:hypothetical protein